MIGIPCFVLREKTARSYQHARGNDGRDQKEEREQVIACTMIEEAHATTEEKMASICRWCGLSGNISDAFAGVPCLTPRGPHASPYRLPTILLLAFSLSAVSAPASPERPSSRNHALRHSRRRTAERSCLMRDTREMKASMGTSASLVEQ